MEPLLVGFKRTWTPQINHLSISTHSNHWFWDCVKLRLTFNIELLMTKMKGQFIHWQWSIWAWCLWPHPFYCILGILEMSGVSISWSLSYNQAFVHHCAYTMIWVSLGWSDNNMNNKLWTHRVVRTRGVFGSVWCVCSSLCESFPGIPGLYSMWTPKLSCPEQYKLCLLLTPL